MSCPYEDRLGYIASYVQGNLSESEQEIFEMHYIGCDACLRTLRFVERTTIAIHHSGESIFTPTTRAPKTAWSGGLQELKMKVREFFASEQWKRAVPAFASLLLIAAMSAGYYWLRSNASTRMDWESALVHPSSTTSIAKLAQLQHLAWPTTEIATDKFALQAKLAEVRPVYQTQKDYLTAADRLTQIAKDFPEVVEVHLYLGVSQLFANRTLEAIRSLRQTLELNPQRAEAQWYLAQAYLLQAQPEQAKAALISLSGKPNSRYAKQAAALLEKLNKLSQQN
ncbi:MAG: tetratricopeptide repeat protein [candidate division KSB1 bacterium]|nr:tetratricopeptide repeat protein [candidate division KSB1 bacterium]